ncbi:MAG TPA: sensor histidine kinase [Chloroflexota bacterium]|nr:sensor histidine kinase [Chloroflexota bacterium]
MLAEAVLAERRRLARELHDGPVQSLWALGAELHQLLKEAALTPPEVRAGLLALQRAWTEVYEELRRTIQELHQALPAENALALALEQDLARLASQTGIATRLTVTLDPKQRLLDRAAELQLIRIAQAALANVRRHAQASQVHVSLRAEGAGVRLCVEDDGVGFETSQKAADAAEREQYGLAIMRERAEALGGHVEVTSALGEGTRVSVWVPARAG